ncbi:MAG: hypothetical protein KAG37_05620 [Flavobacteriales bacterium]|nr:hypothetical protein [Flavobacteriales bacterium]
MEFAKRVVWYLFGALIGVIFVYSWFGNRTDISCNYFPDARVKGDIQKKTINYDIETLTMLSSSGLDSTNISDLIIDGDVVFKKSNTKLDSCKIYFIENKNMNAVFENCDSIVNIISVNKISATK